MSLRVWTLYPGQVTANGIESGKFDLKVENCGGNSEFFTGCENNEIVEFGA